MNTGVPVSSTSAQGVGRLGVRHGEHDAVGPGGEQLGQAGRDLRPRMLVR
ncbi:hypothetical protein [Nonomuraea dietziae]